MSKLEDDIAKLTDDVLTKADAWAAIKIVGEVVGLGSVMAAAGVVISALFGPGGLAIGSIGACRYMLYKCGTVYCDLPSDQRKLVAKLCKKLYGVIN